FFSGSLDGQWQSGWQRCESLKQLGHEVIPFSQDGYVSRALVRNPLSRLMGKVYDEPVLKEFNRDVLAAVIDTQPDIAWFEWPVLLRGETLSQARLRLPDCTLISFQDDNPFGLRPGEQQRWRCFIEAIPEYDLHLVKRLSDVLEFQRRGARRTQLFRHGFYAPLFRPLPT